MIIFHELRNDRCWAGYRLSAKGMIHPANGHSATDPIAHLPSEKPAVHKLSSADRGFSTFDIEPRSGLSGFTPANYLVSVVVSNY